MKEAWNHFVSFTSWWFVVLVPHFGSWGLGEWENSLNEKLVVILLSYSFIIYLVIKSWWALHFLISGSDWRSPYFHWGREEDRERVKRETEGALSIQSHLEQIGTIIQLMMVSSSLNMSSKNLIVHFSLCFCCLTV